MIFLVVGLLNSNQICNEYYDLNIESNLTVKKDDLPEEFSDEALTRVNEFIQKKPMVFTVNGQYILTIIQEKFSNAEREEMIM